jgi:hypothetical protein
MICASIPFFVWIVGGLTKSRPIAKRVLLRSGGNSLGRRCHDEKGLGTQIGGIAF